MTYRVTMPQRVANLLAAAPASVRARVHRHLTASDRERAMAMKHTRTRLVFIFDEPMLLLEVGPYNVFYEMDPATRTVRVRHASGPPGSVSKPKSSRRGRPRAAPSVNRRTLLPLTDSARPASS